MYILKVRVGEVVGDIPFEGIADAMMSMSTIADGMGLDIRDATKAKGANGAYELWIEEE